MKRTLDFDARIPDTDWRAERRGRLLRGLKGTLNNNYKDLKQRIRKLDELRIARGMQNLPFVRALDVVRRAAKRGDSGREPSPELRTLLEKAETLGKHV